MVISHVSRTLRASLHADRRRLFREDVFVLSSDERIIFESRSHFAPGTHLQVRCIAVMPVEHLRSRALPYCLPPS